MAAEVHAWDEIADMFSTVMFIQDIIFASVCVVLFVLVLTGVVNTMLMTVFERVREIGTMMAMGVKRRRVVLMFLFESAGIGLLGAALGALVGVTIILIMNQTDLTFAPPGSGGEVTMYPTIGVGYVFVAVVLAVFGALMAALYPAWRASHLRPAEAIRTT